MVENDFCFHASLMSYLLFPVLMLAGDVIGLEFSRSNNTLGLFIAHGFRMLHFHIPDRFLVFYLIHGGKHQQSKFSDSTFLCFLEGFLIVPFHA